MSYLSDQSVSFSSNERTIKEFYNYYKKKLKKAVSHKQHKCGVRRTNIPSQHFIDVPRIVNFQADLTVPSDEEQLVTNYVSSRRSSLHSEYAIHSSDDEAVETRTYRRRYWILLVFAFYSFFTCLQWNAWGPISASMIATFSDWTYGTVAWMENWVTIMFVICMLPVCWAITRFGIRIGMLLSSTVLAVGLALRCITDSTPLFTVMCHLSSIMLGFSTTVVFSAPPMIASEWFPPTERTTATAFIMASSQLGTVGSYLEPLFIHQPGENLPNDVIKNDVMTLSYIMATIAVALLIIFLVYFPSKPPLHPSIASSTERLCFKEAFLALIRDKNLMRFILIYGIASGPTLGWIGMLNYSLEPLGFDQKEAMAVGLVGILSCVFSSVVAGCLTDHIFGYIRETIISLLIIAASSFYWLLLISHHVIPVVKWQVYVSVTIGLASHYATIPLFYEFAAEMAYPAPEVLIGGFVTSADCLSTSLFLFVYLLPNIGYKWVTYVLVGSNATSVLALLFIKDGYGRSKLDHRGSEGSSE